MLNRIRRANKRDMDMDEIVDLKRKISLTKCTTVLDKAFQY
jgi:hypothetical protein